jgi:alpha-galactosidase
VVNKLSPNDLGFCKSAVQAYDSIKQTIWQGDQYRLSDPRTSNIASLMYVDSTKSSAVMFNYLVNFRYDQGSKDPIHLKGLDPAKQYRVEEINLYPGAQSTIDPQIIYSGDFLMKIGVDPHIDTEHSSVVLKIFEAHR